MKANHGDKLTVFKCNSCGLSNTELTHDIKWKIIVLMKNSYHYIVLYCEKFG
jgi:hypothetical protein